MQSAQRRGGRRGEERKVVLRVEGREGGKGG